MISCQLPLLVSKLDYRLSLSYVMIKCERKMRLTLCFVTVTTAQFSHTNDLRSRKQEEIRRGCRVYCRRGSTDRKQLRCHNQNLFNQKEITRSKEPSLLCYLPVVASLKLTLKRGYWQTMPIVTKLACRGGKLNQAFITANKHLIKFCHQNKGKLIRHQNITYNGLNKGELHLNFEGNERLQIEMMFYFGGADSTQNTQ